jgi:hypothetical protein
VCAPSPRSGTQVENSRVESDDTYRDVLSELDAVTAHIALWRLAAWLDLGQRPQVVERLPDM